MMTNLNCLSHSDALIDALVDKLKRHPAMAQNSAETAVRTVGKNIKDRMIKENDFTSINFHQKQNYH